MSALRTILDRIQGKAPAGAKRSPSWRKVRKKFMLRHRRCAVCGRRKGLEAHHIVPFHIAPDLELNPRNLMALCRRCHLFVGHLGGWGRFNVSAELDALWWRGKMEEAR